jgi:beta-mannosidase
MVRFVSEFGAAATDDDPAALDEQAHVLRIQIEALRTIKYRPTGGFCFSSLIDPAHGASTGVLDVDGRRRVAFDAVRAACAPVLVVAEPLPPSVAPGEWIEVDVHVISDLRHELDFAVVDAVVSSALGAETFRFGGPVPADEVVRVGRLRVEVTAASGPLSIELRMTCGDVTSTNRYETVVRPQL